MRCETWLAIAILVILPHHSEEICAIFKKTTPVFRYERLLYKYIGCSDVTSNTDLQTEILTNMNETETIEYLEVTKSNIMEITQGVFEPFNLTQLTIEAELYAVNEKAFERANISTIILDNNRIRQIGDASFNTSFLYVLSLKNNSINEVTSKMFVGLNLLKELYLQTNQILDISENAFNDLVSLDELNLSFNKLSGIPATLFKTLKKLQTLYLNNNFIKDIDSSIFSSNSALQFLSLQNNYLSSLDGTLYPTSVMYINAENNNIRSLNVSNLVKLNRLIVNNNKLTDLRSSLEKLHALSFLHLSNNFLDPNTFNISFTHLTNLTLIEINGNKLETIDLKIFHNANQLTSISLAENKLKTIDFHAYDSTLKLLNLSSNCIRELIDISNVKGLSKLDLSYNNFTEISYNMLGGLNTLQHLWLHHNAIKSLEMGCFRDLKLLLELNLSYNMISNISAGIFNGLDILTILDISYNNLSTFNEDVFHNMKILNSLNIAYNNLNNVNVRKILSHTTWLRKINLNGNNWTCKSLVNVVRDFKIVSLTSGNSYNISNIYGIPCNDTDEEIHYAKAQYLPDIIRLMNLTEQNTRTMSYKAGVTNCITIIVLILICCKFIFDKYSSQLAAAKQFVYHKTPNEQEMHLV